MKDKLDSTMRLLKAINNRILKGTWRDEHKEFPMMGIQLAKRIILSGNGPLKKSIES